MSGVHSAFRFFPKVISGPLGALPVPVKGNRNATAYKDYTIVCFQICRVWGRTTYGCQACTNFWPYLQYKIELQSKQLSLGFLFAAAEFANANVPPTTFFFFFNLAIVVGGV